MSAVQPCAFSLGQPLAALGALSSCPAIPFFTSSGCKLVQYLSHWYFCTLRACLCEKGALGSVELPQAEVGLTPGPFSCAIPGLGLSLALVTVASASPGHKYRAPTGITAPSALQHQAGTDSPAPQRGFNAGFQPIPHTEKDHPTVCFVFFLCWQRTSIKNYNIMAESIIMAVTVLPDNKNKIIVK